MVLPIYEKDSTMDIDEIEDVLSVMRLQESTTYRCDDYLASRRDDCVVGVVDESWRQRMCEWMYVVVDHCDFNRSIVAIGAKYLDLCLSKGDSVIQSRKHFQLAAMTSLHLAMKVFDTNCVRIESLVQLSRGLFSAEDVADMELHIISVLNWNLHPPSANCFLIHYMNLFHYDISPKAKFMIAEVSKFIVEMAVCVYKYAKHRSSVIAYGAIMISVDNLDEDILPCWQRQHLYRRMSSVAKLWNTSSHVIAVSLQLKQLVEKNSDVQNLMKSIDPHCEETNRTNLKKNAPSASVLKKITSASSPRDIVEEAVSCR